MSQTELSRAKELGFSKVGLFQTGADMKQAWPKNVAREKSEAAEKSTSEKNASPENSAPEK